jgi:hypothetical protein
MIKEYTHPNGYSARLYGKSSLSIFFEGKEISHTGFRNVNTEKEVMDLLAEQPKFRETLKRIVKDLEEDEEV